MHKIVPSARFNCTVIVLGSHCHVHTRSSLFVDTGCIGNPADSTYIPLSSASQRSTCTFTPYQQHEGYKGWYVGTALILTVNLLQSICAEHRTGVEVGAVYFGTQLTPFTLSDTCVVFFDKSPTKHSSGHTLPTTISWLLYNETGRPGFVNLLPSVSTPLCYNLPPNHCFLLRLTIPCRCLLSQLHSQIFYNHLCYEQQHHNSMCCLARLLTYK